MWTTNPKKALSKLRFDYLRKTKNNVPLRVAINLKIKIKQRKNQNKIFKKYFLRIFNKENSSKVSGNKEHFKINTKPVTLQENFKNQCHDKFY